MLGRPPLSLCVSIVSFVKIIVITSEYVRMWKKKKKILLLLLTHCNKPSRGLIPSSSLNKKASSKWKLVPFNTIQVENVIECIYVSCVRPLFPHGKRLLAFINWNSLMSLLLITWGDNALCMFVWYCYLLCMQCLSVSFFIYVSTMRVFIYLPL